MGWFSRKKESNDVDDIPRLPEPPQNSNNLDFNFSRKDESIGDLDNLEVTPLPEEQLPALPDLENKNISEKIKRPVFEKSMSLPELKQKNQEQIFVRLDRFQSAMNSFNEIKQKINEIENLLAKNKEIKDKEQRELEEWLQQINALRARIDFIEKDLFSRID